MKVAVYSHNLVEGNIHLMPWRTVLEVSSALCSDGHPTVIFSGTVSPPVDEWLSGDVRILEVSKPKSVLLLEKFRRICDAEEIEVLYWPLDWRGSTSNIQSLEKNGRLKVVWYIPGAWYGRLQVATALLSMRWRAVLPYVAQVLGSRHRFVKSLLSNSSRPLITMTHYTRQKLIECGYPESYIRAIPPGRADFPPSEEDSRVFTQFKGSLCTSRYFLFFGPPQEIRGLQQILAAFQIVARQDPDVWLVCLFRSDPGLDVSEWKTKIQALENNNRTLCVWESVGSADLEAFITNCYAVLKPFLLVPSEIPLAVIEAAGYGKPVIGTGPDGTGNFIEKFGLSVQFGNSKELAAAMLRLLTDRDLYKAKCASAKQVYENHPTWNEVARQWLDAAKKL